MSVAWTEPNGRAHRAFLRSDARLDARVKARLHRHRRNEATRPSAEEWAAMDDTERTRRRTALRGCLA